MVGGGGGGFFFLRNLLKERRNAGVQKYRNARIPACMNESQDGPEGWTYQ